MKTAFLSQGLQAELRIPVAHPRNTFRMLIIHEEQLLSSKEANSRRAAQLSFSPFHLFWSCFQNLWSDRFWHFGVTNMVMMIM